jgi:hypothetical protein
MMKKLFTATPLIIIAAFSIVSCNPSPRSSADGYNFGNPTFEKTKVEVQFVTYKTRAEFLEAAKKRNVDSLELQAFTELRSPFNKCTIHVMDPRVKYQPEFIGHELAHCIYGQWHTSNSERQ